MADPRLAFLDTIKTAAGLPPEHWHALGITDADRVKTGLAALRADPEIAAALDSSDAGILRALAASCDPDQAFSGLQQWLENGGAALSPTWRDAEFLRTLCMLFAATPALTQHFIRFPGRAQPLIQSVLARQVAGGAAWRFQLHERLQIASIYTEKLATLRRMRVECMLQITAMDILGLSPLHDTARALSDLADACTDEALHMAVEHLRPRLGTLPPATQNSESARTGRSSAMQVAISPEQWVEHRRAALSPSPHLPASPFPHTYLPFVVFALGKLGGRELNYSSDIDLVFACKQGGETVGGARSFHAYEYFTALGEELISALDKVTEDGRVYRVDMRLRPHGSAGTLVRSREEMLNYYQTEGRTWERQAWLKARPIAGDLDLGREIIAELDPFIFRRFLSLEAINDIKALKRQIELGVERRGETLDEVKLGRGGIRDIEFTVQFLQLLYGSEHETLRTGSTLRALHELRREGLIDEVESEALIKAYVFLRNTEHRLQLHGDLQVHRLPSDAKSRRRIALSMGYSDGATTAQDAFEADRVKHTARVRDVFEKLFANLFRESAGAEGSLSDLLLAPEPDLRAIAALLPNFSFADSESAARELVDLSRERVILTSPSRTRKMFASIAPRLLKALAETGEPNEALGRFSRIAGSLGAKSVFYQMLNENPWLLKMTAELAAWSEYLTGILVANPGLFDELVNALQTGQLKSLKMMEEELAVIASSGDIGDTLRAYRAGELLRIGVADLIHSAGLDQTQTQLTDLAEAILRRQLTHTLKAHQQERGIVKAADGAPIEFCVLAVGKFGGREMNYGSDLDVIYFYSGDGQTDAGLPAVSYFAELSQDLTRAMKVGTALGTLYELDARLRPNGTKGPLATSLNDFRRYWKEGQLADWERLALTRARFVAGDGALGERALHLIRSAVYSPLKDTKALAAETVEMRRRLEESAEKDDIKRGRGGIMDIEFVAQFLQLIHGPAFPPLRQSNTETALKALMKFKKLNQNDGQTLLYTHRFLRTLENRVRVVHGLSAHTLPRKPEALRRLALRAGYAETSEKSVAETLLEDFHKATNDVREIFTRVVKG